MVSTYGDISVSTVKSDSTFPVGPHHLITIATQQHHLKTQQPPNAQKQPLMAALMVAVQLPKTKQKHRLLNARKQPLTVKVAIVQLLSDPQCQRIQPLLDHLVVPLMGTMSSRSRC